MRSVAILAVLAALLPVSGCVSWQDRAGAEALEACENKADPDERRLCRETVRAAVEAEHQKEVDRLQDSVREAEERELQRQVYGGPGQVDN